MIQVRYSTSPASAETATTAELRENFLVPDLFVTGEVRGTYTHDDRMVIGDAKSDHGVSPSPSGIRACTVVP